MTEDPYRQILPELELSIERYTENVPADGGWYVLRARQQVGRFRTLKAARDAWKEIVREAGWQPAQRHVSADEVRRREQMERWARNRAG
jgi:hypothetical protein